MYVKKKEAKNLRNLRKNTHTLTRRWHSLPKTD